MVPVGDDDRGPGDLAVMASTRAGSSSDHSSWVTPSSSVQLSSGGSSSSSSAVSPGAGERPQTAERLAPVARSSLSRSLFAFGVVCSWGRMPPSPGG